MHELVTINEERRVIVCIMHTPHTTMLRHVNTIPRLWISQSHAGHRQHRMESAWRWEILRNICKIHTFSFILREDRFLFSKSIPEENYFKEDKEQPNTTFEKKQSKLQGKKEYKLTSEKATKSYQKVGEW